jgi:hypothetical protein
VQQVFDWETKVLILIGRDGQQLGSYSVAELITAISDGRIQATDWAWTDGDNEWLAVQDFMIAKRLAPPPPPPAAQQKDPLLGEESFNKEESSLPKPAFDLGVVNARVCPRCESNDVKKIKLIIEEGTTDYQTTSSVSGSVYVGGTYAPASGRQTTSGTSQTRLAARLSDELKMNEGSLVGIFGLVFLVVSIYVGFKTGGYFHSTVWGWGGGIATFIACTSAYASIKPSKASLEKSERLARWSEYGCYCHRCAHKFIPGSNEAYPYQLDGSE